MTTDDDGFLSAHSAAKFLDMTYWAFDHFVRREGVPHKKVGRNRRFQKHVLRQALDAITRREEQRRRFQAAAHRRTA